MPDVKISALPASTTPLAGTEVLPIVQSATTRQVSVANLTAGRAVNALSLTASSLTSGRVTYAGTAGLLQDNAALTFDGTTLTATKFAGALNGTVGATTASTGAFTTLASTAGANFATTSGSVGIGTTSPTGKLTVNTSVNSEGVIRIGDGATFYGELSRINATDEVRLGSYGASQNITFYTVASERMRITSAGNLLLGTSSSYGGEKVTIDYTGTTQRGMIVRNTTATSQDAIGFVVNSIFVGWIGATIIGVTYNTISDYRLKTNIVDAPVGNINDIKIRSFDWIANGSHQKYGIIAQELIEVAPYAVSKPENPDDMMGVDYSKLVPMMIKEIQDLKQRITALENK